MPRTVLITGATGTVSSALIDALSGGDARLRALVRDPSRAAELSSRGVDAVVGSLGDPDSLPVAFAGADDVWLLTANGPRAPEHSSNAVWAARQAGAERVVRLSAVGAAADAPTRSGRLHALADRELQESGLAWTILRPHFFMQNLLGSAPEIAGDGAFGLNMGGGRLGAVDARDVAGVAAAVLSQPPDRHHGRVYTPTGPRAISFAEMAATLGTVLGRPVDYRPVSDDEARAEMLGAGVPGWIAGMLVEYGRAYAAGRGDFTTNDVAEVAGRPPRDFAAFAREHAGAFRPAIPGISAADAS